MLDSENLNNSDIPKMPFGVKFGVIASLAIIIYSLILNLTGLNTSQAMGYITYLMLGAIMYVASKNYKEGNTGFVSFGGSFSISSIIAAISGAISSIFTYVYLLFIDSSMIDFIKEKQLEEFEKQGMTDAQIEQALHYSDMFMTPGAISIMAFIGMLFFGMIIALIVAAIVKNPRSVFN